MSVSLDLQSPRDTVSSARYDVVVVGAGPYGLSTAAHLLAQGLKVAVFGKPIQFWREHMPEGMLLRSFWWATSLSDPAGKYTMKQYFQEKGLEAKDPLPVEIFIDYALWFQQKVVPNVDETYVAKIERLGEQFQVTLEDGRSLLSKAVVLAPGLHYYIYYPPEFKDLPTSLVSHSAEHKCFNAFVGKHVVVIGGGQGALETAALLREKGIQVEVITRRPLHWVPIGNPKIPAWIRELRAPTAGMGNGWLNFLLEKFPYALQRFPRNTVDHIMDTRHGPAGAHWLRSRILQKVTVYEQTKIRSIEDVDGKARLSLSNGATLDVDHVILGTGYRPNVRGLPMLSDALKQEVKSYIGSPILNNWFESSVPGLYFVGYSAARCFGPFYRFVVGADAAARRVAKATALRIARFS